MPTADEEQWHRMRSSVQAPFSITPVHTRPCRRPGQPVGARVHTRRDDDDLLGFLRRIEEGFIPEPRAHDDLDGRFRRRKPMPRLTVPARARPPAAGERIAEESVFAIRFVGADRRDQQTGVRHCLVMCVHVAIIGRGATVWLGYFRPGISRAECDPASTTVVGVLGGQNRREFLEFTPRGLIEISEVSRDRRPARRCAERTQRR